MSIVATYHLRNEGIVIGADRLVSDSHGTCYRGLSKYWKQSNAAVDTWVCQTGDLAGVMIIKDWKIPHIKCWSDVLPFIEVCKKHKETPFSKYLIYQAVNGGQLWSLLSHGELLQLDYGFHAIGTEEMGLTAWAMGIHMSGTPYFNEADERIKKVLLSVCQHDTTCEYPEVQIIPYTGVLNKDGVVPRSLKRS